MIQDIDFYVSFEDLKNRGIVKTWSTLYNWIDQSGFPAGSKLGPRSRRWLWSEVQAWLVSRKAA